ncbi:MAG: N-acetyltransferase [Candidatus Diapherotrites archaeon]|nr:N-acetyltransferase [Candidatus Diapherotrites archaeon]
MPDFEIRKIKENDALGLSHIFPHWGITRAKQEVKRALALSSQWRLVAEKDSNIAGHVLVKLGSSNHAHLASIYSLAVDPAQRGKGIAQALVKEALKTLPERIEIVLVEVQHDNEPAKSLFAKAGFKQYGYLPNAFKQGGKYKDNILMQRILSEKTAEKP